jgi:hypothetical protein
MRVLIVEDDQRLARLMVRVLKEEHIGADTVVDGNDGLSAAPQGACMTSASSTGCCPARTVRVSVGHFAKLE